MAKFIKVCILFPHRLKVTNRVFLVIVLVLRFVYFYCFFINATVPSCQAVIIVTQQQHFPQRTLGLHSHAQLLAQASIDTHNREASFAMLEVPLLALSRHSLHGSKRPLSGC